MSGNSTTSFLRTLIIFVISLNFYALIIQTGLAQPNYPLAIGNKWNFVNTYSDRSRIDRYSRQVIGDTTFSNGITYAILDKPDFVLGRYIRADSSGVFYYDPPSSSEVHFFRTNVTRGDSWPARFGYTYKILVLGTGTYNYFGVDTKWYSYHCDGVVGLFVNLTEKFGPVYYYSGLESTNGSYMQTDLESCVISDTLYGNPIVAVAQTTDPPEKPLILQNYPNPFNSITTITIALPTISSVKVSILNSLGQQVAELANNDFQPGEHSFRWDATDHASGVYFCRIVTSTFVSQNKLVLVK